MLVTSGWAQDATNAASAPAPVPAPSAAAVTAAQQGADERYERLAADITALQSAHEALQNKITGLQEELGKVREEQARANNSGLADDVKHLADRVTDVDRKREEDKAAITEQVRTSIAALEKALAAGSGSAPPPRVPTPKPPVVSKDPPPGVENGFSYTIKEGDNLSTILKAYNADFKSKGMKTVSLRQAREANPNVDWNRLLVGQKIVIPRPPE
jgi:hypothetical protein